MQAFGDPKLTAQPVSCSLSVHPYYHPVDGCPNLNQVELFDDWVALASIDCVSEVPELEVDGMVVDDEEVDGEEVDGEEVDEEGASTDSDFFLAARAQNVRSDPFFCTVLARHV